MSSLHQAEVYATIERTAEEARHLLMVVTTEEESTTDQPQQTERSWASPTPRRHAFLHPATTRGVSFLTSNSYLYVYNLLRVGDRVCVCVRCLEDIRRHTICTSPITKRCLYLCLHLLRLKGTAMSKL